MKKLFGYAEKYIDRSDWKDLAMLKFCLFAMGVLAGMRIPGKNRKQAGRIAAAVFAATYIPLMAKFFAVIREKDVMHLAFSVRDVAHERFDSLEFDEAADE